MTQLQQPNPIQLLNWKLEEFEQSIPNFNADITSHSVREFISQNESLMTRLADAIEFKKLHEVVRFPIEIAMKNSKPQERVLRILRQRLHLQDQSNNIQPA